MMASWFPLNESKPKFSCKAWVNVAGEAAFEELFLDFWVTVTFLAVFTDPDNFLLVVISHNFLPH